MADPATISFPSQLKAWEAPGNYRNQPLPDLCTFYTKRFTWPVSFRGSVSNQPASAIMELETKSTEGFLV